MCKSIYKIAVYIVNGHLFLPCIIQIVTHKIAFKWIHTKIIAQNGLFVGFELAFLSKCVVY